jgi:hypothetical protein
MKISILLSYITLIIGLYVYNFDVISDACGEADDIAQICSNLIFYFLTFSSLILIGAGVISYINSRYFANFIIATLTSVGLYFSINFILREISDIRTYGSEIFIASFYIWLPLVSALFVTANFYPERKKSISILALILTIIFTVIATVFGRGTAEHFAPLLGGLMVKISLDFLWAGALIKLIAASFAISILFYLSRTAIHWIKTAEFKLKTHANHLIIFIIFLSTYITPLASLPIGKKLNEADVNEAKNFINDVKEQVKKDYYVSGKYPPDIDKIINEKISPWLLKRHEYLAYRVKGSYYFSRAEKFCIIFQNPDEKFGYYSITSERDWKYFNYKNSLEVAYTDLCDEGFLETSQDIVSSYLGLASPDDPIAKFGLDVNQSTRPALSFTATGEMKKQVNELGKKDPTIYIKK